MVMIDRRREKGVQKSMSDNLSNNIDEILDISLKSGVMILQSGGETYRAEETMISIASSLGASHSSAFVTPTVVMLTCLDSEGKSHTRIERISGRTIDLGKIARVNALSRRLVSRGKNANLHQIEYSLKRIARGSKHGTFSLIAATALASFCFTFLFNGSLPEALVACAIGAILRVVLFFVQPFKLSAFIISVIGGFLISVCSGFAVLILFIPFSFTVSIAVLMSLVPGLAIVNAIRDIISGDLVSGSARLLEAFIIAVALSLGAAGGLLLFPSGDNWTASMVYLQSPILAFTFSFFATASFAWFFYITRYDILWAALLGALGWTVYLYISKNFGNPLSAYMLGSLVVGLLAELFAVIFKKPATIYIVPGIIPLVPGGGMYETMLMAVLGNGEATSSTGFRTLSAAAAIAVGIALASGVARFVANIRKPRLRKLFG